MSEPDRREDVDRAAEIFRTAAEIFHRKGFHATAMGEIADAVDLTKAGLYYYVKGKEDLLFAIVSFAMDRLEGWVEPARKHTGGVERLRAVIRSHAQGIVEDGSAITVLVDEVDALGPERREKIRRRQRAYFDFIRDTLKELRREGKLSDIDPTVGAFGILGMVMWLARWYRDSGRLGGGEIADQIADMAMNGLLKKEEP